MKRIQMELEDENSMEEEEILRTESRRFNTKSEPMVKSEGRSRADKSLNFLTKKFLKLLQDSPDGTVDLNLVLSIFLLT